MRKNPPDFLLLLSVIILVGLGVIMVFSASEYSTLVRYNDSFYFFKRQLVWAAMGFVAMFVALNYDYRRLRRWAGLALILAFVLLVAVFVPGVGRSSHGASRWIGMGPLTFQPSELAKLCLILFAAHHLAGARGRIGEVRTWLPLLGVTAAAAGLVLAQPDLGSAASLTGTVMVMLFAAGLPWGHLLALGLAGTAAVAAAICAESYRFRRFMAFLDPWRDPQGSGFHIIQSLYALGSGGLLGVGLGQGRQKLLYIPEQHTDFIFAVLGEELGFVGTVLVIGLFLLFIWRGLRVAITSGDPFATLLATGITANIGLQAVVNIGVVTGSLPVTGITLPFISFGGTSLILSLVQTGILLNTSRFAR